MDTNPYQSPHPPDVAGINAKAVVRPPAICLIVLAVLTLLLDIPIGFISFVDTMRFVEADGIISVAPIGLGTVLVILMHLIVLIGATKMWRLTGYRFAKCAAIVSLIPLCSPGFIIGTPFGTCQQQFPAAGLASKERIDKI